MSACQTPLSPLRCEQSPQNSSQVLLAGDASTTSTCCVVWARGGALGGGCPQHSRLMFSRGARAPQNRTVQTCGTVNQTHMLPEQDLGKRFPSLCLLSLEGIWFSQTWHVRTVWEGTDCMCCRATLARSVLLRHSSLLPFLRHVSCLIRLVVHQVPRQYPLWPTCPHLQVYSMLLCRRCFLAHRCGAPVLKLQLTRSFVKPEQRPSCLPTAHEFLSDVRTHAVDEVW